jgi:FMN phosphatase YigB (HAD superfamily)
MPSSEVVSDIKRRFEVEETARGYTDAQAVALSVTGGFDSPFFPDVARSVLRMPTRPHLYDGAEETLHGLLDEGDRITIWTQGDPRGQLFKVALTGLVSNWRDKIPSDRFGERTQREERKRFGVYTSLDKIAELPSLLDKVNGKRADNIVIVDDKAKNIINTSKAVEEWKSGHPEENVNIVVVWINQGRTKNQVPEDFTLDQFKARYTTIEDIRELTGLRATYLGQTAWLIDLDHTLIETAAAKESMFERVALLLESSGHNPVISFSIDHRLGLNGNVKDVEPLLSGMSGGKVLRVDHNEGSIVVKHNLNSPERIHREIDGYQSLKGTPIYNYLLDPIYHSREEAVLTLPHFNGIQIREGIRTGEISDEIAQSTLQSLLEIKKSWWSTQEKIADSQEALSMQRTEWLDTTEKMDQVIEHLAQKYQIPQNDLWGSPLVIGGIELPSLATVKASVAGLLEDRPPYLVLCHNDATGANILVHPENYDWKLIDVEWAGLNDPAEAFVRMIKYVSTTTSSRVGHVAARFDGNRVYVDADVEFPESAYSLQRLGTERLTEFGESLKDPDFGHRVRQYLAGSYLRELALAAKRGNPDLGLLAMVMASEELIK